MSGNEGKKICVICGCTYEGWGNNPWPIMSEGECCDECNLQLVIPERLRQVMNKEGRK